MTMAIPMVHFVRNTVSGRLRLVPDVLIALLCVNALAQGAAYRLFGVPFIDMLPLTHLLLTAGVAAMLTVLFRSYREKPAPQLRLRMAAFAALGAFGVAALVLYWLLHIYWYDAVYQFGVLLFIILLLHGLISQAAEDMRFHMEHRISHEMQREDRMTGLPNRRAFEEYMERVRTGEAGCLDAVLTYIRLEGLNERNDRFGLQAGDEAVIAAARCVSDFCRECEDEGESVLCFRTGGNEFALIRPEPHIDSGQLHRQFRAVVARYNRTSRARAHHHDLRLQPSVRRGRKVAQHQRVEGRGRRTFEEKRSQTGRRRRMTTNIHYLIAGMAVLLVVIWQYSRQRQMDDRNSRMFRRLLSVVSLDVAAELVSTGFILYAPYSFNVCRMLSNTVFYLFQALLPLLLLYYVCTLCTSRVIAPSAVLRMGIPTIALVCIILTNPFTEMLFYFDGTGYRHGPWYLLLYVSALLHIAGAAVFVAVHRASVSRRNLASLFAVFALAALGIAAQAVNPEVLTTGFGLSLSILAMYLTINNPCACMDSLTGLNDKQYLLRRMDELTDAHKAFHIITVYAYQLEHMNKIAGMRGGDEFLRRAAERMQEIAGRNVFRVTGRRFLLLTFSLREYETCLTRLRELFHTQPDDAQAAPHAGHPVRCGERGKAGHERSRARLRGISRVPRLPERRDAGHPERPQDHGQLPLQQAGRAVPAPRDRGGSVRGLLSAGLLAPPPALRDPRGAQPPAASRAWLDLPGHLHPPRGKEPPHHPDHRAPAAARLPFSARKPGAPREHRQRQDQSLAARPHPQRERQPPRPHPRGIRSPPAPASSSRSPRPSRPSIPRA